MSEIRASDSFLEFCSICFTLRYTNKIKRDRNGVHNLQIITRRKRQKSCLFSKVLLSPHASIHLSFPASILPSTCQSICLFLRPSVRDPGIESRWGEVFCTRLDRLWGPLSFLYNVYRVSFPGTKRPGHGCNHSPSPNAEVKEKVELYLYSFSGPSWPVLGRALHM